MKGYILALDQGTTSSRALVYDETGAVLASAQYPLRSFFPQPGWVEQDAGEIWQTTLRAAAEAVEKSGVPAGAFLGLGLTNQRETTLLWERAGGRPVCRAMVWQCRRSEEICRALQAEGLGETVLQTTGLLIDPYFSATKLKWLFTESPELLRRAEKGELCFGTVDSWLIWNLTGGARHCSDYSNASRTMLFDIDRLRWDETLCRALRLPLSLLPEPVGNSEVLGRLAPGLPGLEALAGLPICGAAGDQQAALFGQLCLRPGMAKNTYGTGSFTLMNTGTRSLRSRHGLLSSVAWSVGGQTSYLLEGSAFNAGSAVQWLRDELGLIASAAETETLARSAADSGGVYFVPAFTGLGAPYWESGARASFFGLTRGSGRAEICRAVLESIALSVCDLVETMNSEADVPISELRVDGGASANGLLMQTQADLVNLPVLRPADIETTSRGAAYLAGLAAGLWSSPEALAEQAYTRFSPAISEEKRQTMLSDWHRAVELTCQWTH